ncbi:MAG: NEW3 domain-containing protein [Thermoplasmatota archaeon]
MAGLRGVPLALLLLLSLLAFPAEAQTHHCGDIQLVFRNPDLQPGSDGFIRAQGQFFAQFQAIGADADKITVFGFSFGPQTTDFDETACGTAPAPWVTGAYVPNYRADRDPTDGFFIPIKTPLVPDGTYAAAVHAYDASNNELARFWAKAIVDNCDTAPTPAQEKCDTDVPQMTRHDRTAPWPIILPGDGQALSGHQLTIEFGETLATHTVYLNGKDITAELRDWAGRAWDADYEPDYGPNGLGSVVAPPCTGAPGQTCERYGPAFEWVGRALVDSDVLRVEATDLAGNKAVKDVHIGSSVAGGAVTDAEPNLEYSVDHLQATAGPGKSAVYHFKISNNGGGTGHPFAEARVPSGWTYEWQPVHVVVPPGETKDQELVVTVPGKATDGRYSVNATLTYTAGGVAKVLAQPLDVLVGQSGAAATAATTTGDATSTKGSPGIGPLAVLALAGLAAALRRR